MAYNSKFTGAQIDALLDASEAMQTSKEDVANKVTSLGAEATDEQYPSAKAVKDAIDVVATEASKQYIEVSDSVNPNSDLEIGDESGNVLVRFSDGHIKTRNFDSTDIMTSVEDVEGVQDLDIGDESGNVLVRFTDGHIKTRNFDSVDIKTNVEDVEGAQDLEIGDENGYVLVRFSDGHIKTRNFDSAALKEFKTAPKIEFHLPNDVPTVKITSALLTVNEATNTISPLTESKNAVGDLNLEDISLEFSSKDINFTDFVSISYQGQTSLRHPKKNFTIDFKNKHKFGDWLEFDSFHLKGYYVDWMHSRDWVANRILEQMWMTKDSDKTRPYMLYNDFNNDFRCRINVNAFCHVDAFPVELYINGVYWGLYTFRIKKNRDNYFLTKKNNNHIQLDPEFFNVKNFDWTKVEIRNPKGLTNIDGTEYDGDNPKEIAEGDVKTHILDFINKFKAVSETSTKDYWESFINVDSFIDAVCLYQFICAWDCFYRNTLYTAWDGVHWSALPYDLDSSFGYGFTNTTDWSSTLIGYNTDIYTIVAKNYCHWLYIFEDTYSNEIKSRYNELKENGIFTVDNVVSLFNEFSKNVGYKVYDNDIKRWNYPTNGCGANGFYDSIKRVETFIENRLRYLNVKYK